MVSSPSKAEEGLSPVESPPACVHVSFHEQAFKTPDAVCVIEPGSGTSADRIWTYSEIQRRVIVLARELKHAGAGKDKVVAIYMEPCADYIVGMLAALTAGAAYVPLEVAYPVPMLQRVLQDAAPVAVLTQVDHRAQLPATSYLLESIICMDDQEHNPADSAAETTLPELVKEYESWPAASLDDLCFVVYSSGTTGQPKGIANPHRAPALSYRWRFTQISDYAPQDRVACSVFFVWEALRPIMRGAAVVPVPASTVFDTEQLSVNILQRLQVTEMLFTPSLLENLLNTLTEQELKQRLASLRTVFLNGEVVSLQLRARCLTILPNIRFINLYSVSECHEVGAVDLKDIDLSLSAKFCPIGVPCSLSPVYILDKDQQPVQAGDAGELYVGGDMLAVGYLNMPEMTQQRFVPDPFVTGCIAGTDKPKLMYRTGDRARFLENGQLEILGRCDFMVKIRGYSIVLGAVEAALQQHVALSSCVVVADGEEGQEKHLVAYLVRAPHDQDDSDDTCLKHWSVDTRTGACPEIRHAVDGALPHYMVPSIFIEVETLPVCAVGAKLDRKALQAQSADRRAMLRSLQLQAETHTTAHTGGTPMTETVVAGSDTRYLRLAKYLRISPGSPVEDMQDAMILLWQSVLGRESLDMNSDFHEQGGHSLSAARLVSLINKVFSTSIPVVQLMNGSTNTVQKMCQAVQALWNAASNNETVTSNDSSTDKDWSIVEEDEERVLQQVQSAAILPEDVVVPTNISTRGLKDCKMVLLTGATGFLGAHVLAEILKKQPNVETVLCLVRSGNKEAVQKNLKKYQLWEEAFASRIVLIKGDLSLPMFGLADADWNKAASTIEAIVHCGAVVSLTAPYAQLEAANVKGTLDAIRLACQASAPLVYVSTNGIFPTDKGPDEVFLENDDVACLPARLGASNGYGLSKWAAERLVVAAYKRGLPSMTIRFGNLGWQSKTGIGNPLDFQGLILSGSRKILARPRVDGWQMEMTPIDFAATALVELASEPAHVKAGAIFNCVQKEFTDAERVFEWVSAADGVSMPALSYDQWTSKIEDQVAAKPDNSELASLQALALGLPAGGSYLAQIAYLDCSKFDAAISKLNPPLERPSSSTMADYFKTFLLANPLVSNSKALAVDPMASGTPVGPLAGRVAVVTGASSGIGRAIVKSLVQAGCHVAMGARRVSELEKTQKEVAVDCQSSSVKTVIVRTDVTKRQDVAGLVQTAEASLGPVDILVNCAGVMYFTLMKNVVWDQWDAQVDVNCKGTMYGIGTVLPNMLKRGRGHIVNITSDAGRKAFAGLGVYSGSKFFVEAVSQALRAETASTGLRVTCIQPGNVETPLLSKSTDPDGLKEYGTPTGAKVLEPADIGRAVVYALSQPEWCAVNEILVEPREEPA